MNNEELVQLYQNGDKRALDKLVEFNKKIVFKLANKFYVEKTSSVDKEDLIQEGFIGLILAVDRYRTDIENPAKFITYAVYWIRQKISRFIEGKNTNDEVSLNTPVGEDAGSSELLDYIEDVDYGFENVEEKIYNQKLRIELENIMDKTLTLKEREILKLRHGWDNNRLMSCTEIGELFSVTGSHINNIERRAYGKLYRTSWGIEKAKEIYTYRRSSKRYTYSNIENEISFAQRYLEVDA